MKTFSPNKLARNICNLMLVTVFAASLFAAPLAAGAQTTVGTSNGDPTTVGTSNGGSNSSATLQNPLKVDSLGQLIESAVTAFAYVAIIIAAAALIWVGFKFVAARGNSEKMKEAKNWLVYIVIGVALILGARLILGIIIGTLEATGVADPGVIQSAKNAIK